MTSDTAVTPVDPCAPGELGSRLYRKLVPVTQARFGRHRFKRPDSFLYCQSISAVPIGISQFLDGASSFPIAFAGAPHPLPVAVLGLQPSQNLMVDDDGKWDEQVPVPDYLQCYPFTLMRRGADDSHVLCVDDAPEFLDMTDGEPLFVDGKPGPALEDAIRECRRVQADLDATRAFAKAIDDAGLLVARHGVQEKDGRDDRKPGRIRVVDKTRLDSLPNETFLDWRRNGFLDLIYLHLVSLRTWRRLDLRRRRRQPAT